MGSAIVVFAPAQVTRAWGNLLSFMEAVTAADGHARVSQSTSDRPYLTFMQNHTQMLSQVGIWLDQRGATLIARDPQSGEFSISEKLESDAESRGGSEHTMNSGKQADTLKYFKSLTKSLAGFGEILIFGPGTLQEQFRNFLSNDPQFNASKISLDTAEHQSDPQMIAQVRNFFE